MGYALTCRRRLCGHGVAPAGRVSLGGRNRVRGRYREPGGGERTRRLGCADGKLVRKCKILDLRFQALPDEITASHSSLLGEFGEWIDVVKDASCARAGEAGAVHP